MEIKKTGVQDLNIGKMSLEDIKRYWETLNINSLRYCLTSNNKYLSEVRDEIKKVEITTKEVEKKIVTTWDKEGNEIKIPFKDWEYGYLDIDNLDRVGLERPASWSVPNLPYFVTSYKDITFVDLTGEEKEVDAYKTPEVLQVIDQWIEYLEKFYAEKEK